MTTRITDTPATRYPAGGTPPHSTRSQDRAITDPSGGDQHAHTMPATTATASETRSTRGRWIRAGLWALPLYGAVTLWATRTHQPDYHVDFPAYAAYISRPAFFWGHIIGSIGGTVLALFGVTALFALLAGGRGNRLALAGFVTSVTGNVLILTLFGVAAFTSPAIGRAYLAGNQDVVALNDQIYGTPITVTGVTGVLLYATGAILFASALWRSRMAPRWAAIAYGTTGVLIGVLGLGVGAAQTAGSTLLIASTLAIVLSRRNRAPLQ